MTDRHRRGRRSSTLIAAVVLIAVGVFGVVSTAVYLRLAPAGVTYRASAPGTIEPGRGTFDGYSSNGERIYYTGIGHSGPIVRQWIGPSGGGGMMGPRGGMRGAGGMACVTCHRRDGRGGSLRMMGRVVDVPDIRYSVLTRARTEGTETVPAWTDAEIAQAIRDGVEPSGESIDTLMPRWQMDETDMRDTIGYLKELSAR